MEEERNIITRFHENKIVNELDGIKSVVKSNHIVSIQKVIQNSIIEPKLIQYIAEIVHQTRLESNLFLGGSPRASLALMKASKAYAAMQGRDFVIPEDIRGLVYPVLRHRIILTPEKEMEGIQPDDILKHIIQKIEVPR